VIVIEVTVNSPAALKVVSPVSMAWSP
jgi:hypothetical protein